jgi:hypothetical protein
MSMIGDVASPCSNSVNSSEKPHRAHGLFVLLPCTCGQQTNVRPEGRFGVAETNFAPVRDEKKKAPEGALKIFGPMHKGWFSA